MFRICNSEVSIAHLHKANCFVVIQEKQKLTMKLTRLINLITKIIQKSENITLIENENLKSEFLHYSLTYTV